MRHMYVADDGKAFYNEAECKKHEASLEEERRKRMRQRAMEVSGAVSQMAESIGMLIAGFLAEYPEGDRALSCLLERENPELMFGIRLISFFGG